MTRDDAFATLTDTVRQAISALRELREERDRLGRQVAELRALVDRDRGSDDTLPHDRVPDDPDAVIRPEREPLEAGDASRLEVLEREREVVRARLERLHDTLTRLGADEAILTGVEADDLR